MNTKEIIQYLSFGAILYMVYIMNRNNTIKNEGEVGDDTIPDTHQQILNDTEIDTEIGDLLNHPPTAIIEEPSQNTVTDSAALHPETLKGGYPSTMDGDGLGSLDQAFKALKPDVDQKFNTRNNLWVATKDLLPDDLTDEEGNKLLSIWESVNPNAVSEELRKKNFLFVNQQTLGVSTVNTSNKNSNLGLRSEPPNPRVQVSPWNNSSIDEVDHFRKEMTIGGSIGNKWTQ